AVISYSYETANAVDALANYDRQAFHGTVGSVYGTVYHEESDTILVAAFTKRHVGYGPAGPGAIYAIDRTAIGTGNGTGVEGNVTVWGTLGNFNTALPAYGYAGEDTINVGTYVDPHTYDPGNTNGELFDDVSAFNAIGQSSFGDMDM